MSEERKSKAELLQELKALRQRICELKQANQAHQNFERQFKELFENTPVGIYRTTPDGRIIMANPALIQMLGYSSFEELSQRDLEKEGFAPDYIRSVFKDLIEKEGKVVGLESAWIRCDGTTLFVIENARAVRDESGKTLYYEGIVQDITEHKKTQDVLRRNEEKYRTLIANLPDVLWTTDCEGNTTFISPNVEKVYGYSPEEIYEQGDRLWLWRIHPDEVEKVKKAYKALFEKGTRFDIEYRIKKKDRRWIWLHDRSIVTYDKDGAMYADGIFSDITEQKKAEQKLRESEEKYRQVVSATTDAVMLFDAETRKFVEVNKACEELYGYSRKEFLNLKHSDITAEPEKSNESIEKTLEGKLHRIPVRYHRKKDGTVFPVEISAGTFELGGRRVLCGVIRDITERKKTEERIRALSSAIEQSIDGIAIGDLEPKLLYVNKAYARMHDYTPEEMIGMPVAKLHNEEQMDTFKARIHQIKTQGFWADEIGHVKKDGTAFPTYMSVTLLKDSNGQPTGILAVTRDITESKRREKEFDDYRQKMARSERLASLGTLGAGLAHELTQPLTVITLLIENVLTDMEKTEHPRSVADKLRDVLNEVSKVTSITKKFRSSIRKSSERVVRHVDLKAVARRTIELFDESARQAKVTLDLTGLDKLPNIYSSEEEIEQLFFTLVENAIQAADVEKDCRLVISGAVKDSYVELRFSDNCSGIAPENLNKIFEPFFTTKPIGVATGLGLCIAEHIVSHTGGKIHVETKLGEGTTFYVTLPIKSHEKSYPKYR